MGLFLNLIFVALQAMGAITNYKPVIVPLAGVQRVTLRGYNGDVKIVGSEKADKIRFDVRLMTDDKTPSFAKGLFDQWIFSYKLVGDNLKVEIRGPQSKEDWSKLIGNENENIPRYVMTITMPARKLNFSWLLGKIFVQNWDQPISITLQSGEIILNKVTAEANLSLLKGKAIISDCDGSLRLDAYDVDIKLSNSKGHLAIENFYGDTLVSQIDGALDLSSFKGTTRVLKSKGQIDFKNGRSTFKISDFEGDVRGKTLQGAVIGKFSGQNNIRIHSEDGPVDINAANSGAYINIGTKKGHLYIPHYLRQTIWPSIRTATGSLRGSQKGYIYVRSNNGNVRIH